MHMRVTWGKLKPGRWDAYEKLWQSHADKTAGQTGLKQRYLLRDTQTENAGYSITLWDRPEDFDAYQRQWPTPADMADCFVGQYVTTVCELRGAVPGVAGT